MQTNLQRQTLFMRVAQERLGNSITNFDATTNVHYNKTKGEYYFDALERQAREADGKLLVIFRNIKPSRAILLCPKMVIWEGTAQHNRYLIGDVYAAGDGGYSTCYKDDGFDVPDTVVPIEIENGKEQNERWVKLDNVQSGTNLDFSEYTKTGIIKGMNDMYQESLDIVIDKSHNSLVVAIRNK